MCSLLDVIALLSARKEREVVCVGTLLWRCKKGTESTLLRKENHSKLCGAVYLLRHSQNSFQAISQYSVLPELLDKASWVF